MYKIKQTRLLVIWLFVVNTIRLFIITKILMRIIHHDANIIHAYGRGSGRTINTTCCVNDNNDIQRYSSSSTSSSSFLSYFFSISTTFSNRTTKSGETILVLATVIVLYSSIYTGKRKYALRGGVRGFILQVIANNNIE